MGVSGRLLVPILIISIGRNSGNRGLVGLSIFPHFDRCSFRGSARIPFGPLSNVWHLGNGVAGQGGVGPIFLSLERMHLEWRWNRVI